MEITLLQIVLVFIVACIAGMESVSYTHLTLPTMCQV